MFSKFFLMLSLWVATPEIASAKVVTTKIKSDFIDIKRNDEVVYLIGHVVVDREDVNILADRMQVYYDEGEKNKSSKKTHNSIKKIAAQNNIKIFNDDFTATGNSGFYYPEENNFILEDKVILNRGLSTAKGEKFVYNLKTKKGNLIGEKTESKNTDGDNRVTIIIDDSNIKK